MILLDRDSFERRTTVDIDAVKVNPGDEATVVAAAERIAERRGWQLDWLNFKASQLAPWWGREIRWEPIHHDDLMTIQVARGRTCGPRCSQAPKVLRQRAGCAADVYRFATRCSAIFFIAS